MSELLFKIEIPDFITRIQVSKSRKPIYYEKNGKHPVPSSKEKHLDKGKNKFEWKMHKIGSNIKILLSEVSTGKPVIKNSRVAGTPKFVQIKGNDFYSGFSSPHQRILIVNSIKDNFIDYFKKIGKIQDFPIYLEFIIHNEMNIKASKGKMMSQDLDNQAYAYVKSSQDLMKEIGIIEDDNLFFIRKVSYEFIESSEKKLIINAFKYKKNE